MVLLHFVKTTRQPGEAIVDEAEIINRKKGQMLSVVSFI